MLTCVSIVRVELHTKQQFAKTCSLTKYLACRGFPQTPSIQPDEIPQHGTKHTMLLQIKRIEIKL
jgi:hypothetical protein